MLKLRHACQRGNQSLDKKHYRLIALAILIGSPVLVDILSRYLPDQHQSQPSETEITPDAPKPTDPMAQLPAPLPPPPISDEGSMASDDGPMAGAMPTLDTSGQSVTPISDLGSSEDQPGSTYTQTVPVQTPAGRAATAQPVGQVPGGRLVPEFRTSSEGPDSRRR